MRRKDREVSAEQAWEIVERCSYGVLAMTKPDGTPYAVPVNFAREGNYLYIHCAQAGEKTDCLNHQPQVCVTCVEGGAWAWGVYRGQERSSCWPITSAAPRVWTWISRATLPRA